MEEKIKQVAQFLFDNAEEIAKWCDRSEIYRTVFVEFANHYTGRLEVDLAIYDEQARHKHLRDEDVTIETFREICNEIDREVGIAEKVPQPELRGKLSDEIEEAINSI